MNCVANSLPQVVVLDGKTDMDRSLLGGKAWGINRMRLLGIPVPPAFALTTDVCRAYFEADENIPQHVREQLPAAISHLEVHSGRTFGRGANPLLVSVRSGAATSMPGMMDTVLNLGLNACVEEALARSFGQHFVADIRERFRGQFKRVVGEHPPSDPWEQLELACHSVFGSWQSPRARTYRKRYGISDQGGTAVTVQAMVFGNMDARSGTGVLFTRNPLTGDASMLGEWLPCAQGEDVVSGRSDALPLREMEIAMPDAYAELITVARNLEQLAGDVQDIEFTVESGKLWVLQTRNAKRSPQAAVKLAVQLASEGLKTPSQAVASVSTEQVALALKPGVDPGAAAKAAVLARGIPACPGIGRGFAVGDPDEAEDLADKGRDIVLVRSTTDPDDVHGMAASRAVVTDVGGATSHAAVVCRELGMPAVVGCGDGTTSKLVGRNVTVDGATGTIFEGLLPMSDALKPTDGDLATLAEWARKENSAHALELLSMLGRHA